MTDATARQDTDEIGPLHTPVIATIGAFVLMAAGLFTATAGGQLLSLVTVYTIWAKALPWILMFTGLISMAVGGTLSRGRFWAALAAVPLAGLMTLIGFVWTFWALFNGFFSLLPLVAAFLSFCALLVVPFSIPGTKRVTEARARLFA